MCHQTVGLVQGALEEAGVVTASVTMLADVTHKIRPPRALAVPWALGYPLGTPGDADLQTRVLRAMLGLLPRMDVPVLDDFRP